MVSHVVRVARRAAHARARTVPTTPIASDSTVKIATTWSAIEPNDTPTKVNGGPIVGVRPATSSCIPMMNDAASALKL